MFTGPGKTDAELRAAVTARLRAITVESAGELARLERIAAAAGRRVPILMRVAVRGEGEDTPILAGGLAQVRDRSAPVGGGRPRGL